LRTADGKLDGAYEVVSVDSETELTVSVLRPDYDGSLKGLPEASSVSYRVSTYGPQARQVMLELTNYFGIAPGDGVSEINADQIVDLEGLKQISVYAVIAGVYATLAGKEDDEGFWKKSMHYHRLFEKVRERCKLSFDVNGDGKPDSSAAGGSIKLTRG